MGGKSSSNQTPSTTTTIQEVKLPPWIEDEAKKNYAFAEKVADGLPQPYQGNTVAGMNNDQNAAFDLVRNGGNLAQPGMNFAQNTLQGIQGYGGSQVQAGQFSGADLSRYMNPYTQQVTDAANRTAQQSLRQSLNSIGDNAAAAGAFGGSRQGVQEGAAASQTAMGMANLNAQLNSQNYQQAQSAIAADQNRALQAGMANQSNGLEAARLRALAATQGAQVGQLSQQANLQQATAQQAVGDSIRSYNQDLLNQDLQRYQDARQRPLDQLQILQYALGVTPYGSTTSGTTTQIGGQSKPDGIGQALGGLGAIMPLFGLLSDEDEKKNIVRLGEDPVTGTRVSAWHYKDQRDSEPMSISPTAQDLAKTMPEAVKTLPTGQKIVHAPTALAISNNFLGSKAPKAPKMPSTKMKTPKAPKAKQGMDFLGTGKGKK